MPDADDTDVESFMHECSSAFLPEDSPLHTFFHDESRPQDRSAAMRETVGGICSARRNGTQLLDSIGRTAVIAARSTGNSNPAQQIAKTGVIAEGAETRHNREPEEA